MKPSKTLQMLPGLLLSLSGAALAQAPGMPSAVPDFSCDYDCLTGLATGYIDALAAKDPSRAKLSPKVRFTENNVEMPIGNDGLWATISHVGDDVLVLADTLTGNAAWFGLIQEHGNYAHLAVRFQIEDGLITEVETVVNRLPDMPKPFGPIESYAHPEGFLDILPEDERRPRERLIAVADGYFNTVELNDGQVFTEFTDDCGRLENGISTTASTGGGSASIAQGCEAQFRLGIYRINKRVRERRFPLVDEERGIVLGSGFFDHANTFDRYTLTDGREMNTVLKWPNSITLLEAFKIRGGKISRIEAVFTYVPYFMHNPFADPNVDFQTR